MIAFPPARPASLADDSAIGSDPAEHATLVAEIFAVDPAGLGGVLLCGPAAVADAWIRAFAPLLREGTPRLRVPLGVTDDRLVGGLDLATTLALGRPVLEVGLLGRADGGLVVVPSAERLQPRVAALLVAALDTGESRVEREGISHRSDARFGLVAVDESEPDDAGVCDALRDRLALHLTLPTAVPESAPASSAGRCAEARACLHAVEIPEQTLASLCAAAAALGIGSARAATAAVRVARIHAALHGRARVGDDDAAAAAVLVLVPRAVAVAPPPADTPAPAEPESRGPPEHERTGDDEAAAGADASLDDRVLAAAAALLPPGLLDRLRARPPLGASTGGGGGETRDPGRGRRIGTRLGDPRRGRLDVLATLRAAAPWQRLRGAGQARCDLGAPGASSPGRLRIRASDFRVRVHQRRTGTVVVFCVDASGSQALHRLAEAKGAVELLLGESYSRRDRVALVAFRGAGAQTLLPPTRSLVRARRALGGLPGGGATPLAAGVDAALRVSLDVRRSGSTPLLVLLTDGRANVARDGSTGRAAAERDALQSARAARAASVPALVVDTAARPSAPARRLADKMSAGYLALPVADAAAVGSAVRTARQSVGSGAGGAA